MATKKEQYVLYMKSKIFQDFTVQLEPKVTIVASEKQPPIHCLGGAGSLVLTSLTKHCEPVGQAYCLTIGASVRSHLASQDPMVVRKGQTGKNNSNENNQIFFYHTVREESFFPGV